MRTLNNAVYVPSPVAGVSTMPCGALYPRLDAVNGVSPQRTVSADARVVARTLERLRHVVPGQQHVYMRPE